MADVNKEISELKLERERLELEKLRDEVSKLQANRARQAINHQQVENDLTDFIKRQKHSQGLCNHRKGGRGLEGINGRGSDPQYAVVHHRLSFGDIMIMCLRCQKVWMPGEADYKLAAEYPTDNEMSESAQFREVKV